MINWLASKRIIITGGAGFPGSQVAKRLRESGCRNIFVLRSKDYNLVEIECTYEAAVERFRNILTDLNLR